MREDPDHDKRSPDYSRCRNAARAAPLSGRIHPLKYTSPLDTKNLMTAEEFQARRILGKPGNRYTDNGDVAEIPSPEEATTPRTATSTTSASTEAETVLSGTTARTSASFPRKVDQNDDFAPNGCFGFGNGVRKRAASPDGSVEDVKKAKKLRSWRAWFRLET